MSLTVIRYKISGLMLRELLTLSRLCVGFILFYCLFIMQGIGDFFVI